jgi:hypothetical protein
VIEAGYGRPLVRVIDGYPDSRLYQLDTALAQDTRDALIDQAWERRWQDFDGVGEVLVAAEVVRGEALTSPYVSCDPIEQFSVPGAAQAGFKLASDQFSEACGIIEVGRQHIAVRATAIGADSSARVRSVVEQVIGHTAPLITGVDDLPDQLGFDRTRLQVIRVELIGLLTLITLAALPSVLSWSRFRGRLARLLSRHGDPERFDVEQARRAMSLRLAALGVWRIALLLWAHQLTTAVAYLSQPLRTIATLAVAFILGLVIEQRILRVGSPRRVVRLTRGAAVVPSILGATGTLAMLIGALLLVTLGFTAAGIGSGLADIATWQVRASALVTVLLAVFVLLWSLAPTALGRRISMAMMRDRPLGEGSPVLLLRTFGDDRLKLRTQRRDRLGLLDSLVMKRRERFEELVTIALAQYGAPVAVGRPGEKLPPGLGGQRVTFSNDTWQAGVNRMADDAALICMTLGKTAGLSWEMNLIASSGFLHKTVFLTPPVKASEQDLRLRLLAESYSIPPACLEPELGRRVLAFCWPLGWTRPFVVTSAVADDLSYDLAIEACKTAITTPALPPADQLSQPPALPRYQEIGLESAPHETVWDRAGRSLPKVWIANFVVSSLVIPIGIPMLTGDPLDSEESATRIIPLNGLAVTHSLGGEGTVGYGVVNHNTLIRGDFEATEVSVVEPLDDAVGPALYADGAVYYATLGLQEGLPVIAAVDVTSGELWKTPLPAPAPTMVLADDRVIVASSVSPELLLFDGRSGAALDPMPLPCRPWGVASRQSTLWISCPLDGLLLEVEADTIVEHPVPVGATQVLVVGDSAIVVAVPHQSTFVDGLTQEVLVSHRVPMAVAAANDTHLAVEGVDRISLFGSGPTMRRNADPSITSMTFTDDGKVQYSAGERWLLLTVSPADS